MEINIQTAQNVHITRQPAGLLQRITATCIDLSFLGGITILASSVLLAITSQAGFIIWSVLISLYHLVCEYFFNGRSLGKQALHLRVVRLDGRQLTFWDCLLRWLLRLVDISLGFGSIAMLSIIATSKSQRLGDLAASTTVIQEGRPQKLQQILPQADEGYTPLFPAITMLSDKDMAIIREVIREAETGKEYKLYEPLAAKIKEQTGIQTTLNNREFVHTALKDYTYLTR